MERGFALMGMNEEICACSDHGLKDVSRPSSIARLIALPETRAMALVSCGRIPQSEGSWWGLQNAFHGINEQGVTFLDARKGFGILRL